MITIEDYYDKLEVGVTRVRSKLNGNTGVISGKYITRGLEDINITWDDGKESLLFLPTENIEYE